MLVRQVGPDLRPRRQVRVHGVQVRVAEGGQVPEVRRGYEGGASQTCRAPEGGVTGTTAR